MHIGALSAGVQKFLDRRQEAKGELEMLITKKMLLGLTLVGALIGAGIGALVTRSASGDARAENTSNQTAQPAESAARDTNQVATDNSAQFRTSAEQTAYRRGFDVGLQTGINRPPGNSFRTGTHSSHD